MKYTVCGVVVFPHHLHDGELLGNMALSWRSRGKKCFRKHPPTSHFQSFWILNEIRKIHRKTETVHGCVRSVVADPSFEILRIQEEGHGGGFEYT